jgi:hypothetical protein
MAKQLKDGTAYTDEGKHVELESPAVPGDGTPVDPPEAKDDSLSRDEQEALVGDLEPGDVGHLPLNKDGTIAGPAKKGPIPDGTLAASVQRPSDDRQYVLSTPAGAPLSKRLNPDPVPVHPGDEHSKTEHGEHRTKT